MAKDVRIGIIVPAKRDIAGLRTAGLLEIMGPTRRGLYRITICR